MTKVIRIGVKSVRDIEKIVSIFLISPTAIDTRLDECCIEESIYDGGSTVEIKRFPIRIIK